MVFYLEIVCQNYVVLSRQRLMEFVNRNDGSEPDEEVKEKKIFGVQIRFDFHAAYAINMC